jgi:SSS family transporter
VCSSDLLPLCIALVGCTTMLYTFAGGMKSIVWNDCIQFAIYLFAALLAAGVILDQLPGGWNQFVEFARQHDKFRLLDLSPDLTKEFTLWSGLVGGVFISLATHGTDQLMVQRYLAARSQKEAGRALVLSGLVVFGQFTLFLLIGVGLACFFQLNPPAEPLANDKAFAAFIVAHLPQGIKGLTLAGVFAAAMSVLSGSLNSSAAAAVNDWYRPARKTPPSDRHLLWVSRSLTVVFGAILMAVALAGPYFAETVVTGVLRIASFASGLVLGVFFLGVLTRHTSQRDALVGLVGGLIVLTTVIRTTPLAWPWFALVGSMATLGIGWAASWLGKGENQRWG